MYYQGSLNVTPKLTYQGHCQIQTARGVNFLVGLKLHIFTEKVLSELSNYTETIVVHFNS